MRRLLFVVALFVASSAWAADLDLYIGFTGIATQTVSGGTIRDVTSQIGSNEDPSTAVARMIFTTLTVKASDGTSVCSVSVEKNMVTKPAVRPLQFRIFYPTPKIADLPLRGTRRYTLYGKFTIEGNPPEVTLANNKHQFDFDFPSGGTPSCISLLN